MDTKKNDGFKKITFFQISAFLVGIPVKIFRCVISSFFLIFGPLKLEKTNQDFHDDDAPQSLLRHLRHVVSLRCEVEPYLRYARLGRRQFCSGETVWKKGWIHPEKFTWKLKKNGTGGLVQRIFLSNWVLFG